MKSLTLPDAETGRAELTATRLRDRWMLEFRGEDEGDPGGAAAVSVVLMPEQARQLATHLQQPVR